VCVNRMRLTSGEQTLRPITNELVKGGDSCLRISRLLPPLQQFIQDTDQLIRIRLMPPQVVCQRLPCAGMDAAHPADDHLAEVIQTTSHLLPDERRNQRAAFLLVHLQHPRGIKAGSFLSNVPDCDRRDRGQEAGFVEVQGFQPFQSLDQLSKFFQGWRARIQLDALPERTTIGAVAQ
jgi:hypothetical protein